MSLSTTRWKSCYVICLTKPVVFISDARPVFYVDMWHGTQLLKALCNTLRYDDISMLLVLCLLCVMNVLWLCYECVMNVLWMICVMNVLWMCYGWYVLWMCYGSVMNVLYMCYGCVRDVLWIHWGLLLVKDVCVMDEWWIFYIYWVNCIGTGILIVIL